jgi:hypothetical protein
VSGEEFLDLRLEGPCLDGLTYDEVDVRLLGESALVQGVMHCRSGDECESTRYTHVWRRRFGAWHAVATHLTRVETRPRSAATRPGRRLRVRRQA